MATEKCLFFQLLFPLSQAPVAKEPASCAHHTTVLIFRHKIKNTLYPYSCNNIKKYSKVKIKLHKCSCIKNNAPCSVFEKTLCPAIYTSSNDISIDNTMCNGCLACKLLCSQGAVS